MSSERFNRQFILIDFRDLDNPEFLAFVRAPEFSTYLLMRRFIWRSRQPHHMGLEELYDQGLLACSLDREKIGDHLGGVSIRTVSNDLAALERREVIAVQHTGRQNIYVLGRWGEEDGAYYEIWFLDRLHVRDAENFPSDGNPQLLPIRQEENFPSDVRPTFLPDRQGVAAKNREEKRERNREGFEFSKAPLVDVLEARRVLGRYVEDLAREFRDEAPLAASTTRTLNLYSASGLDLEGFMAAMLAARQRTQERTPAIKKTAAAAGPWGGKNKMPYFFGVLADLVGIESTIDEART